MSCLVLLCFLHGPTVRMYRLSPVPVSLVSFPIFPTAPSYSPLLGKVNRPKHSSPFFMVAHCFTIGLNAVTRKAFLLCLFTVKARASLQSSVSIPMHLLMSAFQQNKRLSPQIPDYFAFLFVFLCVSPTLSSSHPFFCFLGAS